MAIQISKNRNSPRGGFGMAKHTCGSKPYVRKREEMRNPETGEYPDMVTFMEETHKRKDGTFVDKKAEAIARKCREMEQEKLTQLSQLEDTPADYQLSQVEKDLIFCSEVEVRKGRRYGVGSIPFDDKLSQSSNFQSYEEKYRQTQTELMEAKEKIKEMDLKIQDVAYWADLMAELHPGFVPPSQRNQPTR